MGKKAEHLDEIRIREAEDKLLTLDKNPESPDQFDRLLLGSPNDSQLWIKYMSFHLQVRIAAYTNIILGIGKYSLHQCLLHS